MRLRKVKMAGFKSFVDPTSLVFPSDMVGIVGPNGCGKSNIVDAVRWVMGASTKNIRGDTLEDVIFKGSSGRQPVGQASIELVFDNSMGKVGGKYASYNEISIRRQVARDGQSKYYLNSTHCRRRDIVDIFLGTGLGPRSYAIIEQGMISRLIDAKPEEMRVYLEEAAGISKYKERRRETENRIRHTRENLDRLNDLIDEVSKQITKLKRQATIAEKYKTLKSEERRSKAELLLLRWQAMKTELIDEQKHVEGQETQLEQTIASLRAYEAELEQLRVEHASSNEATNKIQGEYYQIGADISRLEQSIQHATETKERHQTELKDIESNLINIESEVEKQNLAQQEFEARIQEMQRQFDSLNEESNRVGEAVSSAEQAELVWRDTWDQVVAEMSEPSHQVEVHTQRIEFLEQESQRLEQRKQKFMAEHAQLTQEGHEGELAPIQKRIEARSAAVNDCKRMLDKTIAEINGSREQVDSLLEQLDEAKSGRQEVMSELSTLQALQDVASQGEQDEVKNWITKNKFSNAPRLADQIKVESGWEQAVEMVLGDNLGAICTSNLDRIASKLHGLQSGGLVFLEATQTKNFKASAQTLASKVKTDLAIRSELQNVFIADNVNQALKIRKQLQDHESVVTPEGVWISSRWLRYYNAIDTDVGVLRRKARISELEDQLSEIEIAIASLEEEYQDEIESLDEQERQREDAQQAHNLAFQQHAEIQAELVRRRTAIEHWQQRDAQLRSFIEEANTQLSDYVKQIEEASEKRDVAQLTLDDLQQRKDELLNLKEEVVYEFSERKEEASELQERRHALQLEIEASRTRTATSQSMIERLRAQEEELLKRTDQLNKSIADSDAPIQKISKELKNALEKRLTVEQQLGQARKDLEQVETVIREKDEQRLVVDNLIGEEREALNQRRMRWQELNVRAQTIKEQLDQYDWSVKELTDGMREDASLKRWEEIVKELEQKINRLGSINLAAIDEYKEQSERKEYLDSQHADLTKALNTLETAIRKIDKETKERFKDTFDRVNSHIQRMYPRLFPGGKAYLEMSGDDLLTSGVTIMARPPGKRVSSIQLLSGGEKALTAAALVLAIFELNPAPFCLLDEVDAPLDDANVGRFCELIKDMSERVQFVFITHNKTTMEYAEHLLGVTMNEPGVSRLVSVDIEEAAELATAS